MTPVYSVTDIKTAYQLNWSLTIFWRSSATSDCWLPELKSLTESDGVRILSHKFAAPNCSQFLISTRPETSPVDIPRAVKGRLQHLIRRQMSRAFQRNYDLHSIGSTQLEKAERYVSGQIQHHFPDCRTSKRRLADLQLSDPETDLSRPRFSAHARFRCNLHLVFVHNRRASENRFRNADEIRSIVRKTALKHGHLLSRMGIMPDHLHLILGLRPTEPPIRAALSYMNNIAFLHGMKPILMNGCYMGTVGNYDLGAVSEE